MVSGGRSTLTLEPFTSIVVPTRGRAKFLSGCLASLLHQNHPSDRYEIIVVDDGSSDDTSACVNQIARANPGRVRYIRQDPHGSNAARNRGVEASTSEIVCFIDDDEIVPNDYLTRLLRVAVGNQEFAAVGGPYRTWVLGPRPRFVCERCLTSCAAGFSGASGSPTQVGGLLGGNMAIWRTSFARYGLFDGRLSVAFDETEWFYRAARGGARFLLVPDAWVYHQRRSEDFRLLALVRRHIKRAWQGAWNHHITNVPIDVSAITRHGLRTLAHASIRACVVGAAQGVGAIALAGFWLLTRFLRDE